MQMTDKWPLHPSIMSYSIDEAVQQGEGMRMVSVSLIANHELQALYKKMEELERVRDVLREELESARRIIDDLGVACEDEFDLPELETLIVQHKRRFGGRE